MTRRTNDPAYCPATRGEPCTILAIARQLNGQLALDPEAASQQAPTDAQELSDHRRMYTNYEAVIAQLPRCVIWDAETEGECTNRRLAYSLIRSAATRLLEPQDKPA